MTGLKILEIMPLIYYMLYVYVWFRMLLKVLAENHSWGASRRHYAEPAPSSEPQWHYVSLICVDKYCLVSWINVLSFLNLSKGLAKRAATAENQLQRWSQLLDVQRSLAAAVTAASDRLRQLDANPSTRRKAVDTRHALQVSLTSITSLVFLSGSSRKRRRTRVIGAK